MSYHKFTILFSITLFSCLFLSAQTDNKYVYRDSSGITTDQEVVSDTTYAASDFQLSADSIEALKNSKDYYYARTLENKLRELNNRRSSPPPAHHDVKGVDIFSSGLVPIILWTIAGLFIVFILYKIFSSSGFFSKNVYSSKVNELPEEIEAAPLGDYELALKDAIRQRNYRLAVRFVYLQVLKRLSEKKLVTLEDDKTNYQYVVELNNTIYKDDFADITLFYEYIWYGEFELNEDSFNGFYEQCKQFNNRL